MGLLVRGTRWEGDAALGGAQVQTVDPPPPSPQPKPHSLKTKFRAMFGGGRKQREAASPPGDGGAKGVVSGGGGVHAEPQRSVLRQPPDTQESPRPSSSPLRAQQGRRQPPRPLPPPHDSAPIQPTTDHQLDAEGEARGRERGDKGGGGVGKTTANIAGIEASAEAKRVRAPTPPPPLLPHLFERMH